jgi:4'-phosphopantetheinyl transferase
MQWHQVDLWYVFFDKVADPALKEECRSLMSPEEVAREQRLIPPQVKHQLLVSRALVRTTLTHYAEADPRQWKFRFSPLGKPSIEDPPGLPWEFNLTHTRGLAVCAVSPHHAVGVDAEHCDHKIDYAGMAKRFFHPTETAALEDLPPDRYRRTFFQFWTLKESYLKAHGAGLSMPLDRFAFSLGPDHPPRISEPVVGEEPAHEWHFAQFQLSEPYEIAVAIALPPEHRLRVRVREVLPLRWEQPWQTLAEQASNRWILA